MRFLSTLFLFVGYCFIYAAVAAGGKFATEPWAVLFADAYEAPDPTSQQFAQAAGPGYTPLSPVSPIRPRTTG